MAERVVIFIRDGFFYPLTLPESADLAAHARANPGTLRIEDAAGNVLWRPDPFPATADPVPAIDDDDEEEE